MCVLAAPDHVDSQGATALDYANNRRLNYCILVFTSYQKYKERLKTMHAALTSSNNQNNRMRQCEEVQPEIEEEEEADKEERHGGEEEHR